MNNQESHWSAESNENESVISYILPGVEKSQIQVKVEPEDGESVLVVYISERAGGGIGSQAKNTKFRFFPKENPRKISAKLKNGVLILRIPKDSTNFESGGMNLDVSVE